jgi:hypothetical protein
VVSRRYQKIQLVIVNFQDPENRQLKIANGPFAEAGHRSRKAHFTAAP